MSRDSLKNIDHKLSKIYMNTIHYQPDIDLPESWVNPLCVITKPISLKCFDLEIIFLFWRGSKHKKKFHFFYFEMNREKDFRAALDF